MVLFSKPAVRVHFESDHRIADVRSQIIQRLNILFEVDIVEDKNESDVNVVFCPIVSRAGTDIDAALSRIKGNKHTIVIVLHQTNEPSPVIPTTREYGREGVILVDVIFSEDRGLLSGQINTEAFKKAASYLKEHASEKDQKKDKNKHRLCKYIRRAGIVIVLLMFMKWNGFFFSIVQAVQERAKIFWFFNGDPSKEQ